MITVADDNSNDDDDDDNNNREKHTVDDDDLKCYAVVGVVDDSNNVRLNKL